MNAHLTDEDRAELARVLRDAIEADRYPFSPKVRRWKDLLAKLDRTPEHVVTPYPAPRPAGQPSFLLGRKRRR